MKIAPRERRPAVFYGDSSDSDSSGSSVAPVPKKKQQQVAKKPPAAAPTQGGNSTITSKAPPSLPPRSQKKKPTIATSETSSKDTSSGFAATFSKGKQTPSKKQRIAWNKRHESASDGSESSPAPPKKAPRVEGIAAVRTKEEKHKKRGGQPCNPPPANAAPSSVQASAEPKGARGAPPAVPPTACTAQHPAAKTSPSIGATDGINAAELPIAPAVQQPPTSAGAGAAVPDIAQSAIHPATAQQGTAVAVPPHSMQPLKKGKAAAAAAAAAGGPPPPPSVVRFTFKHTDQIGTPFLLSSRFCGVLFADRSCLLMHVDHHTVHYINRYGHRFSIHPPTLKIVVPKRLELKFHAVLWCRDVLAQKNLPVDAPDGIVEFANAREALEATRLVDGNDALQHHPSFLDPKHHHHPAAGGGRGCPLPIYFMSTVDPLSRQFYLRSDSSPYPNGVYYDSDDYVEPTEQAAQ